MGCTSSTEVVTDPITGQEKIKKKLGGAYPGQRPPQHSQYAPSDFNNGQATAHFIQYGGGNALVLGDGPNPTSVQPQHGQAEVQYVSVTLPAGVNPGDTIHVQAPDGRLNAIVVPSGMYAGSTFTVQFETGPTAVAPSKFENPPIAASAPAEPEFSFGAEPEIALAQPAAQDDFASGFGSNNRPTYY